MVLAVTLLGGGCGRPRERRESAIGEAYVSHETLKLRQQLSPRSETVATLHRGERVEILQRRRRFLRVRTAANQIGWTDQSQLLTPEVYQQIHEIAAQAEKLPSFGVYRTRDKLNMHMEPQRWGQVFYQLREGEAVELLGRQLTERTSEPPEPGPQEPTLPAAVTSAAPRSAPETAAAASSTAGGATTGSNAGIAASAGTLPGGAAAPSEPGKPKRYDEWYFVRTMSNGAGARSAQPGALPAVRAGWVLARMVYAGIPDEVAQYAEGHAITSYFSLGEVHDGQQVKKIWLWTTTSRGADPEDFDSFRVFNWGRRRHRYETAYIERRINGYFPVSVTPEVRTRYGSGPGFSLVVEKDSGKRYVERYVMLGAIVRRYEEEPFVVPAPAAAAAATPAAKPAPPSLLRRLWNRLRRR